MEGAGRMRTLDRLQKLLPEEAARLWAEWNGRATQIRLRAGRPVQFAGDGCEALTREVLKPQTLRDMLAAMMEYSVYARQQDMDNGFFTLEDGSRVGVCGRMHADGARLRMDEVGSACIRVAREIPGCADGILDRIAGEGGLESTLMASPPGLGKTTLLRDLARSLSGRGYCVGIADERHEIAACRQGVPMLDVGARTDVMDGCPRAQAVASMIRTMAPQVIVVDEIGGGADADALEDAARCGVAVVATAHAARFEGLRERACLRSILDSGVLKCVVMLGPRPGRVREIWRSDGGKEGSSWERE